ncbi:hypothetical protein D3C76_933330 [compost metagenome]
MAGLRQHEQQRQAKQPASPPGAGGQQQQGQEQPIALVSPSVQAQGLSVAAQVARAGQQAQAAQVAVVQPRGSVAAIQLIGEGLEARAVQAWHQDRALGILEVTAIFLGNRGAFAGADTQHQPLRGGSVEDLADALAFLFIQRRTDQQDSTVAEFALVQQGHGLVDGQVGAMAALGHDRRHEGFEQVGAGGQVVGQRHQGMRTAGIDDDRGLGVAAVLQQVQYLAPGLFQARRRNIGGEHFRGEFQHHHQRVGGFLAGLFDPRPARSQQRQHDQQPTQAQGNPRQPAFPAAAATEQHGMEGRRQDHLPAAHAFLSMPQLPEQPAQQRQQQYEPGAQPVWPEGDHRRLRKRRRLSRWRHSVCWAGWNSGWLNRRCNGLSGQRARATSNMLNSSATARGQ